MCLHVCRNTLLGPRLAVINPLLWEIGHVAWFQEKWVLRHAGGKEPIRNDADALYDSIAIPHDTRWDLLLPSRIETLTYMHDVHDRVLDQLHSHPPDEKLIYFVLLSVFHEDMHTEAFTYTRQTLGYPPPRFTSGLGSGVSGLEISRQGMPPKPQTPNPKPLTLTPDPRPPTPSPELAGDVHVPGGTYLLGATPDEPFVFDNEKWAHPVTVEPFAIAPAAVTQSQFVAFVEDDGYQRRELWNEDGWRWRQAEGAEHPVYWRRESNGGWRRRSFDAWIPLEPHFPVLHVNWYEADAYCRWADRRLPTEAEWEMAASAQSPAFLTAGTSNKRRFSWGDDPPTPQRANLDGHALECVEVGALPEGDSAIGCRQMIGNVWEWTASDFLPYPGFEVDPYKEYSQPWFGTHKVLRGGCWVTRSRLLRNTYRNYYTPDRSDVWAGFRTCALEP